MLYVLYTIFFISCLVLIGAVLLQPGKTDAGALFTSNVSSAAFGPRGTASVLSKLTITAAVLFMISALLISMPALTGGVSVLSGSSDIPVETTEPAAAEQQTDPATSNTAAPEANGALIETPATNAFQQDAANSASNTASNTAPAANANAPANR